ALNKLLKAKYEPQNILKREVQLIIAC
ncbi:MAG: hypothetical protein ACI9JN_001005, partial [Bacteroidia bacterium]